MTDRFSIRSAGVVLLVCCVALAGCGGGSPETTAAASTNESGPTASAISSTAVSATGDGGGGSSSSGSSGVATGTPETAGTGTGTETAGEGKSTPPSGATSRSALVTRVIDGDTVEVRYRNGGTDTIRLLGVDTPEVSGDVNPQEFESVPDSEAGREHLREWATRASSFARNRLEGREVQIVTDPQSDRRGRYGRLLAYVVRSESRSEGRGGENGSFNAALLRGGYARVYESSFTERERYERIEARAQERGIGLWGFGSSGDDVSETSTESGSSAASGLVVARIKADAPGDDNETPNGEYVTVENRGPEELDLGGWQVSDEGGHTYVVPAGVVLAPGARLTLYSGRGAGGEDELYWGSASAIWNNGGDTVTIRDANGSVVTERSYGPT